MNRRSMILGGTALVALAGCSNSKFRHYNGPRVTAVVVNKEDRRMYLLHHDRVLKNYRVQLGFAPVGHKEKKGDGRTPEGVYLIDRRNPDSKFHLSLGISYPNAVDRQRAKELNADPGGDIFIHGQKHPRKLVKGDWTWGCIAVTNREIEDVYAMVGDGTPIKINP